MRLVYSEPAVEDLRRLRSFIAEHDPGAAARVAAKLVERMAALVDFPRLGIPVSRAPDPDTVRDLILDDYIVRYSRHAETIVVLRVWHHHENRA